MKKAITSLMFLAFPLVSFAAGPTLNNTQTFVNNVGWLIYSLLPITVSLALLYFFWGLAKFILAQGNEEKKKEGRDVMTWGVIALFVMVSIWGIVYLIATDLGLSGYGGGTINVPGVNFTVPS